MKMESYRKKSRKRRSRSSSFGFAPGKRLSSESASLWSGSGQRTSAFQERSYECCEDTLSTRRKQFEGCVAEPLQTITAILPGSMWSCLLLRSVLQDASSEVTKIYPSATIEWFLFFLRRLCSFRCLADLDFSDSSCNLSAVRKEGSGDVRDP